MRKAYCDGIEYILNDDNTASVCGTTTCFDISCVYVPSKVFDSYTVVSVAPKAFFRASKLRDVFLPETVREIGASAFAWCGSLKSIVMSDVDIIGERAFMGCSSLCDLAFPCALSYIGDKAFAYCTSLTSAVIPDGISEMGEAVFEGCRGLTHASLPQSLKLLPNATFYACTSLEYVDMPIAIEYVDEYAFAYCVDVSVSFPERTVLNKDAFYECGGIRFVS